MQLLIIVLTTYFAIAAAVFLLQEKLIFYPVRLDEDFTFSFRQDFSERNFYAGKYVKINSLHFKISEPAGIIIYFHGNAGSLAGWGNVAGRFTELGYDLLIYDYRQFGKSTGQLSEKALFGDARFIYDQIKKEYPEEKIILFGRSIGTAVAVYTAAGNKPGKLILETPFYSLKDLAGNYYPWLPTFLLKYPMRSDKYISDVKCPVIIIHGTNYEIVSYDSALKLHALIQPSCEFISIDGGGHNNLDQFKKYQAELRRVLNFEQ